MAKLAGSFPLKFNGKIIGKAYIVGQDSTSITVDIAFDNPELLNSITELIEHAQLPDLSFGFIADLPEPKGLMQVISPNPIHWEKLKADLDGRTRDERAQAIRNYVQERYARLDKD